MRKTIGSRIRVLERVEGMERLDRLLMEPNIRPGFYASPGTAHCWQTWRRDLNDFAPRLFQQATQ